MTTTSTISAPSRTALARVAQLRAYHVRIPLKKTIKHASHSRDSSDNVVVECRLDDGTVGYGEGVPRDYVTGESLETSMALLRAADWSSQLQEVDGFPSAVALARRLALPAVPGDDRGCIGNAARCAAELALLDAFGRRFGVGLHRLAAQVPECAAIYEPKRRCRYSGVITSKSNLTREVFSAIKNRLNWFKQVKIKVGAQGQDDPRRLRVLRRTLGRKMDIRIDANEAWSPDEVVERIRELEPFGVTAVEQPVPHEQVACLAKVRKQIHTPVMLDESLCSRIDADRAIAEGTCDIFNIRLSKCGGLLPSLELAALAHSHGLRYQLGCQVGETGILSAAGRHFACSIANIQYLEGSYDHFLVRERLTKENLTFEYAGIADALTGPGLGITVERSRLEQVTQAQETLYG